jgi:regulator of cell morphogenesis and NO signaling
MSTKDSLRNRTVGDIAAKLPGATGVFRKLKLDFCCGGDVSLAEAARERGLDVAAIEDALVALDPNKSGPAPEATGALIDHIIARYHEVHRRELPELIKLAKKVEAVHAHHPQPPRDIAATLNAIQTELEKHMQTEETEFFPLMKKQDAAGSQLAIPQLRHDHDQHGELLRRLEALTNGFVLPEGACRSWEALWAGGSKLVDDVMEHIHLENNVLFPRFEGRAAA